jgi:toxin HigB-1
VIQSFADRATERLFQRKVLPRPHPDVQKVALRKLSILDAAETLQDTASPPGNRLEKLTGDRAGQHSIRVNDQYRICFTWTERGAEDVELTDHYR